MTMFWKKWILTPSVGWSLRAKYLLPCWCIRDSLWYATGQCSEKLILTFCPHPQCLGWGLVGWGFFCGQNICYNVAAFVIPFNLIICNMTMFWKSWILTPPPGSGGGGGGGFMISFNLLCHMIMFRKKLNFDLLDLNASIVGRSAGKIFATVLLYSWFHLIWYATWPCSEKV